MKRLLSAICIMIMILSMTACGGGDTDSGGNSGGTSSETTTGAEAANEDEKGEPTHLVMNFMTFIGAPNDTQIVQDAINEITRERYNIEVELQISDISSYRQALTLALSSGEQLDLVQTITAGYNTLAQQGFLMDLEKDGLIDNYGTGIAPAIGQSYVDACRIDGVLYGVPNGRDMAQGRGCAAIGTQYLEGIGYEVDESQEIIQITVEELNEIYVKLHETYPELEVYRPTTNSMLQFSNVDALGGTVFGVLLNNGQELKVENLFTSDYFKDYAARMYDYNQMGYISQDAATDTTAVTELVKSGVLMSYTTGGKPGIKQQETNLCGMPMTIFQTMDDYVASAAPTQFPWVIPINTVDAEASMTLLNAFYTDEDLANLLSWGIEGTHYKVLDSGLITYADGVDAGNSGWSHNVGWELPNQFITYVWDGNSPTLWEDIKTFNTEATKSAAMGFSFDTTNVATEITSVTNVYSEYQMGIEYGFLDPATAIDEMNDKMMTAGLDKIIAEKQSQLDAWAAANK